MSASVDFLSLHDMCWPVFLALLMFVSVCVKVCIGRQTDTEERLAR